MNWSVTLLFPCQPFGTIAIQLAQHRGAKVISTAHSLEDKQYLERLRPAGGEFEIQFNSTFSAKVCPKKNHSKYFFLSGLQTYFCKN